jgi:hypothetical protein
MRNLLTVLFFVAMTFTCWGLYGPVLHEGQVGLGFRGQPSSLRPLMCVGIAYFLIAVLVPLLMLRLRGEKGRWTITGAFWSFMAGTAGAVGALGIVMAFKYGGKPIFVMPLVFGLAPVMNTLVTMWMTKTFRQASPIFIAGVIIVAIGAAGVMSSKPTRTDSPGGDHRADTATEVAEHETTVRAAPAAQPSGSWLTRLTLVPLFIALTACCWGSYGPVLHKGQMKMAGSRLRPFLCVGLAYFVIAVLAPLPLMKLFVEAGAWTFHGVVWSLAGGAAGALGALGIIMAFNFGGKPIYVMPLVFGGAPVINTLTTILHEGTYQQTTAMFFASLMLVVGGAVTVLVFAPRGKVEEKPAKPKPAEEKKAQPAAEPPPAPSAATSTSEPAVPDRPDAGQSGADKTDSETSKWER